MNPNPDRAERHATSLDRETSTIGMAKGLLEAGELMGVPSGEGREFVKQVYAAVAEEPAFTPRVRSALSEARQQVLGSMAASPQRTHSPGDSRSRTPAATTRRGASSQEAFKAAAKRPKKVDKNGSSASPVYRPPNFTERRDSGYER